MNINELRHEVDQLNMALSDSRRTNRLLHRRVQATEAIERKGAAKELGIPVGTPYTLIEKMAE